jgi:replicative DNA helicase
MKNLENIKQSLVKIANQNRKEDLKSNVKYWDEVITDIQQCSNESKLLEIAQIDFGFDSFDQVIDSVATCCDM